MKKISKVILNVFRKIALFIDKLIIIPITKLILKVMDFFKGNAKSIDRFVSKKSTLLVVSLVLAFGTYLVVDRESSVMIDQYAEILYDRPVTAAYNEEAYVVEGLPDTVDITLVGQKRHIFLAKQSPSQGVSVDLTGLGPGNHRVTLKYNQSLRSLNYKLDPANVTVTIYEKHSKNQSLSIDTLHKDNLDSKLYIDNIELDRTTAIIKGADYKIEKVASVKALVDVNALPKQKVGEITLKEVPLVAYDSDGKLLDVEIVPKTVTAKLNISSPSKEIPIKIIPRGNVAFGTAISSMDASISKITVYGTQEAVDKLEQLEVPIDVENLSEGKEFTVTIKKPTGITELSSKTIKVKVNLSGSISKEFENIPIQYENLDKNKYNIQATSANDVAVNVVVKGSEETINKIDSSSIKAYIDLEKYGVGTHEVDVKVTGDDLKLSYTSKTKKVKVVITEK